MSTNKLLKINMESLKVALLKKIQAKHTIMKVENILNESEIKLFLSLKEKFISD